MGDLAFTYTRTLIVLLHKAGYSYVDISLGTGVSYAKVRSIAIGTDHRISTDTVSRVEAYAIKVTEGEV